MNDKQFILAVTLHENKSNSKNEHPYTIPAIARLGKIELHQDVTFFIGENGAGKSTLLEAIAVAYGLNAEGGSKNFTYSSRATHSPLYENICLIKGIRKPVDSYFLRAETFYNVMTNIEDLGVEAGYGIQKIHDQSHGEAFMSLFLNRFKGGGLYILDEPEAALSPLRQLAFLRRLNQLIEVGAQFLIATHSPVILAYPKAYIYNLGDDGIKKVKYEETDHFIICRRFMNDYKKMLSGLMEE